MGLRFAGSFIKCSKDHCALGQVLVVGKDGQISEPTEQALKKLFYAGPAGGDPADVTWHLSVKYGQGLCGCCTLAVAVCVQVLGLASFADVSTTEMLVVCPCILA